MSEVLVGPIIQKPIDALYTQTLKELSYFWNYKRNIDRLKEKVISLKERREAINLAVDAAKNNAEVIGPDVLGWMQRAEKLKEEAQLILVATASSQMGCSFHCKCPNVKVRYSTSKKAAIKAVQIEVLHREGEFTQVGYPTPPGKMPLTSPQHILGFGSRISTEKEVIEAFKDQSSTIIGVCGMGGIGKTTLVKSIVDRIKKDKVFDEVAMAVVSGDLDLKNIQKQLAENLGMSIEVDTLQARAERLYMRLMNHEKSILVVLDDLWQDIDLHAIGIPSDNDRKGLKVLLTSRFVRVCTRMGVHQDVIIEVKVLSEEEAWYLFSRAANISDEAPDALKEIAKRVAMECKGLPLALVVVGKILKNIRELSSWRDSLRQLQNSQVTINSEVQDEVYSKIEWSLKNLKIEGSKSVLLLCSLFPEDYEIEIEDLVRYAQGLQIFKNTDMIAQTRDRLESAINELKDCYLVTSCKYFDSVKLHDVVRDTCLSIATKDEHVYFVSRAGVKGLPQRDGYDSYTAISFDCDEQGQLPDEVMHCSRLQLLRLVCRYNLEREIFKTRGLQQALNNTRVVHIEEITIEIPLTMFQASANLRTLCLKDCLLVGDLAGLKSLSRLESISFFDSNCEEGFPTVIAELANLKSLDLRFSNGSAISQALLPSGILLHLKNLEEIYLGSMYLQEATITELGSLSNLNTIQLKIQNDAHIFGQFLQNLNVDGLFRFYISVHGGSSWGIPPSYHINKRRLDVPKVNFDMILEPKMKKLLRRVDEELHFNGIEGSTIMWDSTIEGSIFPSLRNLIISDCDMKILCKATDSDTNRSGFFVQLETLIIERAENLEELYHGHLFSKEFENLKVIKLNKVPSLRCLWGPIRSPCLGNLTQLVIEGSNEMKSVFLISSVNCFYRLQCLEIYDCRKVETLVHGGEGAGKTEIVNDIKSTVFPELEILKLQRLTRYQGLSSDLIGHHQVKLLDVELRISVLPKLREVEITGSDHILNVMATVVVCHNLFQLAVCYCDSLEVVFDFEGWRSDEIVKPQEDGEKAVFDQLSSLDLKYLPKLRHLWRMLPTDCTRAFSNLIELRIEGCGTLKYLLTSSMAEALASLEKIYIDWCEGMEAIIRSDEDSSTTQEIHVVGKKIVRSKKDKLTLPRIKYIELFNLPNLRMFCSQSSDLELPSWNTFSIGECPKMTRFCTGQLISSELIQIGWLTRDGFRARKILTKSENITLWVKDYESGKRCIHCALKGQRETCHHLNEENSHNYEDKNYEEGIVRAEDWWW